MKKILPLLLLLGICFSTSVKALDLDSCSVTVWQDSIFLPDSIVLYANGTGTPPFTYEWNTGDTTNPLIVWDTITFCVTVTDADGCTATGCIDPIVDPTCWSYISQTNNGAGVVYNAQAGGTPPYQYFWSTGETTQTIVPDSAGDYCLYVIDGNGCVTPNNCVSYGGPSDSCWVQMQASPIGNNIVYLWSLPSGSGPYDYTWSDGSTNSSLQVSTSGTYCLTVVDAAGCVAVGCYDHIVGVPDSCSAYISLVGTVSGGTLYAGSTGPGPYSYLWSTGETSWSISVFDEGNYCVNITDANGCEAITCFYYYGPPVVDSCAATISALPSNANAGEDLCAYSTGPGPYTYLWSTGETNWLINVVDEGNYCVTVVDGNGCEASTCYYYDGITVTDTCSVYFITQVDSVGILIEAFASGTPPFTYLWEPFGFTTQGVYATDPGSYCVTVVDANGCETNACFFYTGNNNSNDSCSVTFTTQADAQGAVINAIPNGNGPFTYLWNPYGFTTPAIYVTDAGSYCVTIIDADGCVANACYYYTGNTNPDSCSAYISALPATSNSGEDLCAYSTGPGPYTYLWSTGQTDWLINVVDEGIYCVTVVDANGCEANSCYYYAGSTNPVDTCFVYIGGDSLGLFNGILFAHTFSTNPPYTYLWSTGETSQYIQVLTEGPYCVTMTNSNGCQADYCVYAYPPINAADSCEVDIFYIDTLTNGIELYANYISGVGPFTFEWSTGDTLSYIQVLDAGTYCVTMTNVYGCVADTCFNYDPGDFCSVFIYQGSNGTDSTLIADTPANGPTPFTYLWSNGETTQEITPLNNGTYCVTLTNGNGCTASDCHYYNDSPNVNRLCGVVHLPDSSNLIGSTTVSLYLLENGGTTFVKDQYFSGESNNWWFSFYGLAPGDYIVKAAIDAGATAGNDYVPTYFQNAVLWEDADVISLPDANPSSVCHRHYIEMIPDGNVAGTGNGALGGNVQDLYGALGGVTVLLYDEFGNLIDHVYTDANGEYNFYNLPLGSYQVVIEYTGYNHAEYWVSLTTETPRVLGLDFKVDNGFITTGTYELAAASSLKIYPNPISDQFTLQLDDSWDHEVSIKIVNLDGKVLANLKQGTTNHVLQVSSIDWGVGMYFYQINDGRQMASGKIVKQ